MNISFKKIFCLFLAICMLSCLAACGKNEQPPAAEPSVQPVQEPAAAPEAEPTPAEADAPAQSTEPAAQTEVTVSTVDEFLAAIAPNTAIVLTDGVYDLSTAAGYGEASSDYYQWEECFDGVQLKIRNVANFSIRGGGTDKVTFSAIPRYANVLNFEGCSGLALSGFTAGHTEEPGSCIGGVLRFEQCSDIDISACSLYGCGVIGISAENCENMLVDSTEIYDCSTGDLDLRDCKTVTITNANFHDNGPARFITNCQDATIDSQPLETY